MSVRLRDQLTLALAELRRIRREFDPLLLKPPDYEADTIERAAACAMLPSFYTQIEKAFVLVARDFDGSLPASDSWHRDLLRQMASPTERRAALLDEGLLADLGELLAFRHLFRGASIVLMRWDKLQPLLAKVDSLHMRTETVLHAYIRGLG